MAKHRKVSTWVKAVKCIGWVCAGIGIVFVGALCFLIVIAAIIALAEYTIWTFRLPTNNGFAFLVTMGYTLLLLGIVAGIGLCLGNRDE